MLLARVSQCYSDLCAAELPEANAAISQHLRNRLLPGLAIYRVVSEYGDGSQAGMDAVECWLWAVFGPQIHAAPWFLSSIPRAFRFNVIRAILRWQMRTQYSDPSWTVTRVLDDGRCYGYDITRCLYLDKLTELGAPELTPLYCQTDDWFGGILPVDVEWARTTTLGRGDERCDFRWRSVESHRADDARRDR